MQTEDDTTPSDDDLEVFGDLPEEPEDTGEAGDQAAGNDGAEGGEQEAAEAAAGEPPPEEVTPPEEDKGGQIPPWRLREIREERDRVTARAEELERRALESERRLAEMERQQQEAKRSQEPPPNLYDDPQGYQSYFDRQVQERVQSIEQKINARFVDASFVRQRETNPEAFGKAWESLQQADRQGDPAVTRIINAPDPGFALMAWHRERDALSQINGDLEGFLAKQREAWMADPETRKQVFAAAREEAAKSGRSSIEPASIPSLNNAPGGGRSTTPDQSGDEMLIEAMSGGN